MVNPYKLLIIDDNKDILTALNDFLSKKKYDVVSASDGLDGLKLLETEKHGFDLVITDLIMPNISGVGLIGDHEPEKIIFIILMKERSDVLFKIQVFSLAGDEESCSSR